MVTPTWPSQFLVVAWPTWGGGGELTAAGVFSLVFMKLLRITVVYHVCFVTHAGVSVPGPAPRQPDYHFLQYKMQQVLFGFDINYMRINGWKKMQCDQSTVIVPLIYFMGCLNPPFYFSSNHTPLAFGTLCVRGGQALSAGPARTSTSILHPVPASVADG